VTRLYNRLVLLLLATLFTTTFPHTATAVPSLTVQDELKFTFPVPNSTNNILSFLIFSTEGDVSKVSVQTRQIKTPDGAVLPAQAATARLAADTVSPRGVMVSVTLDPAFFVSPGEYRIVLFFQSEGGAANLSSTLVVNRPAADINLPELTGQTVALTRPLPLWPASHDFLIYLRESTGRAALNDFKVAGQSVYKNETKELVPGEVTATLLPDDTSGGQAGAPGINPGGVGKLKVTLSDLRYAGTYDTALLITSPNLSGAKVVPLKVTVTDFVLFPLLAIALGVFGGYWARRLVREVRPRNQNSLHLLQFQTEVERFREVVKKQTSREAVQNLLAQIRRAQENNTLGDFAAVREALPKIQEQLDAFRKAQVQAEGEAQTNLTTLQNQVEALEQGEPLTAEESRDLHSIKDRLADTERLLRQGMAEDAQLKIENVTQLLLDLRKRKFVEYFKTLQTELLTLTLTGTDLTTSETLKTEIQALLNSNDLDKLGPKLAELKTLIETQQQRGGFRGARETEAAPGGGLADVPTILPPAPFTRIQILTAPEERIAGATINFAVADVEQIIQPDDELRWFFGDVGSFEKQNANAAHRYQDAGRFSVRVEIIRNGALVRTLSEMITISPGEIEQARAGILKDIVQNELTLSIIALVLATITGLIFLYSDKVFGSLVDYLMAILWGFGIDNSIKGFSAVLGKIGSTEGQA